jgi:hypothetical protein
MEYNALIKRLFHPANPQQAEAVSCLSEEERRSYAKLSKPNPERSRELWERFISRGLLPASWAEEPGRLFGGCNKKLLRSLSSVPLDVMTALCVAANAEGIQRAEQLAFEVISRLQRWYDTPTPERLVWVFSGAVDPAGWSQTGRPLLEKGFDFLLPEDAAESKLFHARRLTSLYKKLEAEATPHWWLPYWRVKADVTRAYFWEQRMAAGGVAPSVAPKGKPLMSPGVLKKPLRDVKNPFEPLLDLWETGYALADFDKKQMILVGKTMVLS